MVAYREASNHISLLRINTVIRDKQYSILFYLYVLCDKQILDISNPDLLIKQLRDNSLNYPDELKELSSFHSYFSTVLNLVKDEVLKSLIGQIFNSLIHECSVLELFEAALELLKEQNRNLSFQTTPVEIKKLMKELASVKDGDKIYNPFAGTGSFAVFNNVKNIEYLGQEINEETYIVAKLRLMIFDYNPNIKLLCEDVIENFPEEENNFDVVVSVPPLNMRLYGQKEYKGQNYKYLDDYFLIKSLGLLSDTGRLITVVSPDMFIQMNSTKNYIRKQILKQDVLDKLILLPANILGYTSTPIIIIVLNKNKAEKGTVKLVDGSSFFIKEDRHTNILDKENLLQAIVDSSQKFVKRVSNEYLLKEDGKLNFKKEFLDLSFAKGDIIHKPLNEFIESLKIDSKDLPKTGPVVGIGDLKNDGVIQLLDINNLAIENLTTRNHIKLSESALLVTRIGKNTKATLFLWKGKDVFLKKSILAYKINREKILPEYLVYELHSENVKKQFEALSTGHVTPLISVRSFLKILIPYIPIEEQKVIANNLYDFANKMHEFNKNKELIIQGNFKRRFDEFAELKHTLGRPRQVIDNASYRLIRFLENNEDILQILDERFKDSFMDTLKRINYEVNLITRILEKTESSINTYKYPKTFIKAQDVDSFLNSTYKKGKLFKIDKQLFNRYNDSKKGDLGLDINLDLLKILIDNIVTNTEKYAFEEIDEANRLHIKTDVKDGEYILEISNNGKPFSKELTQEKFVKKYNTSNSETGTGIGGAHIDEIASYFENEDWKLILDEEDMFPVRFLFKFKIEYI